MGSPDSPAEGDVRRFLRQFLMDGHVIDVPYPIRKLIVELFVLPRRPKQSAKAYASIWRDEGSPLIVMSRRVEELLRSRIDEPVALAMRYGNPSIRRGIDELISLSDGKLEEILLVPSYPHYAMSTTGSTIDEVEKTLKRMNVTVRLKVMPPYYSDDFYINALTESMRGYINGGFDHLLFSYHGLPERHLKKADPTGAHCLAKDDCCSTQSPSPAHAKCYRHQAFQTTELVVRKLGIPETRYSVAFQSRIGRDKWLSPYTSEELVRLGALGTKRLLVVCPSFVSDCLETLEEIGMRGKAAFFAAGGGDFEMIPCLNDHSAWIGALENWCGAGK